MNNAPRDSFAQPPPMVTITAEDQRVIQECNREAFYQRCLPYSVTLSGVTYLAVRGGYWKPHASWGAIPKVVTAAILGYFIGKVSYQQICAEKLMAIPDSPIGTVLRARRQRGVGTFQDSLTLDMPGYSLPDESSTEDVYRDDLSPHTFTDLDTDRPYNSGLDDTFRLNVDSPQQPEDFVLPPQAPISSSYEELRRKNREDFERKSRAHRSAAEESQRQPQLPYRPPSSEPLDHYKPTNVYGDLFEK